MTHQIPEYYHTVSELLSNILDNAGYSRADRHRKVRIAAENDVLRNIDNTLNKRRYRTYMFGSRGDGCTGPGLESDKDLLHEDVKIKVVTDVTDYHSDKDNYLMVKDDFTHPGYVKLQLVFMTKDHKPVPIYRFKSADKLLTLDTLNRSVLSNIGLHKIGPVSGPALQFPGLYKELSVDSVFALRCSKWPRDGYEWFIRRRLYGWPTPKQIENAWKYGCFVTHVGHPHSSEQHLEWRLSFSIAERDLVWSFEDTAMKVYVLLKMIKTTYIEPVVGDALSSYHCKVCMFWMRESTSHDLWRNENLLLCLIFCIRQLYEWATAGFCPDYFIVTNNVYDRKLIGTKQFNLVQILEYLLSSDCKFLLGIECCCLGQRLANGMSGFDLHYTMSIPFILRDVIFDHIHSIDNTRYVRESILQYIPCCYPTLVDYLERFMYASKCLPYIMQYPLKYVMMVLWSQLGFQIATVCRENARLLSGEEVNYLMALASSCLSLGIKSDVTSVRLKLCGLGMELGYYDLMEVCLQHMEDCLSKDVYISTFDPECIRMVQNDNTLIKETVLTKRYSTEDLMQTRVSFSVSYMPSEIPIIPTPLRMEIFRSTGVPSEFKIESAKFWYYWSVVDSVICLYFFQYLNFSRQGKERHKQAAMDNMIHLTWREQYIFHRDTALNLLGHCFIKENHLTNAFICFAQSLKIRPYHNAGKFHLGVLFNRVHTTHRHLRYGNRRTEIAT